MKKHQILRCRHRLHKAVREYFDTHGFVEIDTPVRIQRPALEDYIDAVPSGDAWLRTSPELHMKQLVADGLERIYQIGPCFRADEHGNRHRSEFTMLEWYQAHADYRDLIPFTIGLLRHASAAVGSRLTFRNWDVLTVDQAFRRFAGSSAQAAIDTDGFDLLLVDRVEPRLGRHGPTFLIDYPASLGALARLSPANADVAERWELYINGLEIANTYSELIDPEEQRRRFERTAALRLRDGRAVYEVDEAFLQALRGMPPSAGCALGIDRLLMALLGLSDIADVLAFPAEFE